MTTCTNRESFWVERGFDYKEIKLRCGETDPHGERVICDSCLKNADKMKSIRRHEANVRADNSWLQSANWGEI